MSVFEQSSEQVRSTLRSMPAQSRYVAIVIALAMITGMVFWSNRPQTNDLVPLFGGRIQEDHDLDLAEISFSKAGLTQWQRADGKLLVPAKSRHQYLAAIDKSTALPVALRSSVEESLKQSNLFESDSVRKARHLHAKARDLGNQLATFDDIRWASVVHDVGKSHSFGGKATQSASVVVCPVGNDPLPPARIHTIREFIGGAYAGMSRDDVVVIDKNAEDTLGSRSDPAKQLQMEEKARIKYELAKLVSAVEGAQITVSVQTNLADSAEPPKETTSEQTYSLPNQEADLISGFFSAVTRIRGNRSAKIESLPNDPISNPVSDANRSSPIQNEMSPSDSAENQELVVANISVAIGLPKQFFVSHAQQNATIASTSPVDASVAGEPIDQDEIESIRQQVHDNLSRAVMPILMAGAKPPQQSSFELWVIPEVDPAAMADTITPQPMDTWSSLVALSRQWPQATWCLILVVALLILSFIWSIKRRQTDRNSANAAESSQQSENDRNNEALREELVTLVDGNPELAAEIIHSWVGEAA